MEYRLEEKKAIEKLDYELTYSWVHNQGISKETLKLFKDIIEKQEKVIDEMAEYIRVKTDFTTVGNINAIKQYFYRKVEEV